MTSDFSTEQIGPVAVHTFSQSTEAAVDAWAEAMVRCFEDASPQEPVAILVDVSAPQVDFSRYARKTSQWLFNHYRQHPGKIAFIFSSRTAPYFARIFFASLGRLHFEVQSFNSRESGLRWLQSGV